MAGRVRPPTSGMKTLLKALLLTVLFPFFCFAQNKTIVSDFLSTAGGSAVTGTLTVTNNSTMITADGFTVPQGQVVTAQITSGQFSISLVPNVGAAPYGSVYYADYVTKTSRYREIWNVPNSATAVNLLAVRVVWPQAPNVLIPASQVVPPPTCTPIAAGNNNLVLRYTTNPAGWICAPDNIGAVTMDLENPTPVDAGKFNWEPKNGLNLTRISCSVDSGSVSVNLDIRTEAAPNSPGTQVLSVPLVCTPTTGATTAITFPAVPPQSPVALLITSTVGSPGIVRVHAEYILN